MEKSTVFTEELLHMAKEKSGLSLETLKQSLRAILSVTCNCLDNGQCVYIDSFGKFSPKTVNQRTLVPPPPYNQPVVVPKHRTVRFKPAKNILWYHIKY